MGLLTVLYIVHCTVGRNVPECRTFFLFGRKDCSASFIHPSNAVLDKILKYRQKSNEPVGKQKILKIKASALVNCTMYSTVQSLIVSTVDDSEKNYMVSSFAVLNAQFKKNNNEWFNESSANQTRII